MMSVIFHGVRGSHPVADAEMVNFGGNTSCVEIVKSNDNGLKIPIILDAGSGLIKCGYALAGKLFSGEYSRSFPLLFTHLHPDHTEGFTFFTPNFLPFCEIYVMGMEALKQHIGIVLKYKMMPPCYPIEYEDLKSKRIHRILRDGDVFYITQEGKPVKTCEKPLFEVKVMQSYAPSHPQQGALYYRITDPADGSSVACIWDIESHIGGDVRVINFAQKADIMIHDTQYSDEEYASMTTPVQGFGHSTYSMAMKNAEKANVKYLLSFHYNPRHKDSFLSEIEKKYTGHNKFEFIMTYEGLCLTLEKGQIVKSEKLNLGFGK
ncbi:MAG: MBL fold metallo-hydrolase [Treponema sp.]|jgi:ribonuclease BN (tRNA processing enzyme)|nr:MBL fold metallo-hydrolase [Treponema sp.]